MKRRHVALALTLALLVGADQAVQRFALSDGELFGRWVIPFDPPLFTDWQRARLADYEALAAGDQALLGTTLFDPELGWCPRPGQTFGLYQHDWAGARIGLAPLAREKPPGRRRVVVVGGSFAQGAEVRGSESWAARVQAGVPGLEVANLGVAGYGVDQAYLRMRRDGLPLEPDEVWLALMPEASPRVTTHFPPVFRHWSSVASFKPLFVLEPDGSARLVPNPVQGFFDFVRLMNDQQAFVAEVGAHDHWVRRTPAAFAPRGSSWTHHLATTRLAVTLLEAGDRDPEPMLADPRHEVRRLTHAILQALARDARAAGAEPRIVVLPGRRDVGGLASGEPPYWAGLVRDLEASGLPCLDVTEALLASGRARDPAAWMPNQHYGPELNALVAETVVAEWLR